MAIDIKPATAGTLFKWTNYVHGWQPRYFILKNGILMYHKSEHETSFGCRGAIAVKASTLTLHEFDWCRFDVGVCDYVWYLRAENKLERDKWIRALQEQSRAFDDQGDHQNSIQSTNNSLGNLIQQPQQQQHHHQLHLNQNLNLPQDRLQQEQQPPPPTPQEPLVQLHQQLEEQQQEQQHLQYSDNFSDAQETFEDPISDIMMDGPMAGPHNNNNSNMPSVNLIDDDKNDSNYRKNEDVTVVDDKGEFIDSHQVQDTHASETRLATKTNNNCNNNNNNNISGSNVNMNTTITSAKPIPPNNPLWPKIDQITSDQLYYAQMGLGQEGSTDGWQLFAEDGQMRLYTRELEIDGLVCDPLKAVHVVRGITGYEMCHRFFSPNTRFEWEQTLESMKVVEEIDKDTLIFHQIHKRIWPAAQRDAVFWSHIRKVQDPKPSCLSIDDVNPSTHPGIKLHNIWIVCNNSTDKPEIPVSDRPRKLCGY